MTAVRQPTDPKKTIMAKSTKIGNNPDEGSGASLENEQNTTSILQLQDGDTEELPSWEYKEIIMKLFRDNKKCWKEL